MPEPQFKPDPDVVIQGVLDGWRRQDQANRRAVLFVHGILGKREKTWKAADAERSFPELLVADPAVGEFFDAFCFKYKTKLFSGPAITNVARQLDQAIEGHLAAYQLVLLAHSMGGLVCMRYILDRLERSNLERSNKALPVVGLLMYGTPTNGVEWLEAIKLGAGFFRRQDQLAQVKARSQFLLELQRDWVLRVVNGGNPSEPAERRAWLPVQVVTGNDDWVVKEDSAKWVFDRDDWHPVQLDHRALVKPSRPQDISYLNAAKFLALCRDSLTTDCLQGLRALSDWVRNQRGSKLIREWNYHISFYTPGSEHPESALQLEGFSVCEVHCSYTLLLTDQPFVLGLTLGAGAARRAWEAKPAYLHQIFPGGMKTAEQKAVFNALRLRLKDSAGAWGSLFENVQVKVAEVGTTKWHDLVEPTVKTSEDSVLASFDLPLAAKPWVGREVTLKLEFRSLRPDVLNEFTLQFPWLTSGFEARITVYGATEYLFAAPYLMGPPSLPIGKSEDIGDGQEITIREKQLVLPGSSVRIEWLPR
jgi:pimeloyl-ACP methyl ester carboxylesterase